MRSVVNIVEERESLDRVEIVLKPLSHVIIPVFIVSCERHRYSAVDTQSALSRDKFSAAGKANFRKKEYLYPLKNVSQFDNRLFHHTMGFVDLRTQ